MNIYLKVLILYCNLKVLSKENSNENKKKKQVISHCEVWLNFIVLGHAKKIAAKIQLTIRPENSHRVRLHDDICQIMPKIIIQFDGNKENPTIHENNR